MDPRPRLPGAEDPALEDVRRVCADRLRRDQGTGEVRPDIDDRRRINRLRVRFQRRRALDVVRGTEDVRLGVEADVSMIMDERPDIVVNLAAQAGVRSVSVSWGYGLREALVASHPDHIVDRPDELLSVLLGAPPRPAGQQLA